MTTNPDREVATLAGGCSWCLEAVHTGLRGVESVASGCAEGSVPDPIVTEVAPAGDFWEAEPEHQDYLLRNPGGYTCHFVRPDWVLPRRKSA